MKKNWWAVATIGMFVIVIVPLLIAGGLSFRLINTDTTNEWIGFWGGYLGSLIGGAITLYVMKETNKEARENLKITLQNEKELEQRKERIDFATLLIEKNSVLTAGVEDVAHKAIDCFKNGKSLDSSIAFSESLRYAKAIALEMYMHFQVKSTQEGFEMEKVKKMQELAGDLHVALDRFYPFVLKEETTIDECSEKQKELYALINVFGPGVSEYAKELLMK